MCGSTAIVVTLGASCSFYTDLPSFSVCAKCSRFLGFMHGFSFVPADIPIMCLAAKCQTLLSRHSANIHRLRRLLAAKRGCELLNWNLYASWHDYGARNPNFYLQACLPKASHSTDRQRFNCSCDQPSTSHAKLSRKPFFSAQGGRDIIVVSLRMRFQFANVSALS